MKKDVLWGYLAQFLQFGAALMILPVLLKKLSSAELGVWYVFMTISALVGMLDSGFTPTLARNISFVLGGAKRLHKNGYDVVEQSVDVDYGLLKAIVLASRHIFFIIAAVALALLTLPGSFYIEHVIRGQVDKQAVLVAWGIFVFATILNLFYKYYTPLLQGRGLFGLFYKSSALANIGFVVVSGVLLQFEFGLQGVAIGYLVSALIGRCLCRHYLFDAPFKAQLDKAPTGITSTRDVIKYMWPNAFRLGMGVIGAFLILRANTLLSSIYLGLATTGIYALTLQVFLVLQGISTVLFNIQLPKLAQYRITNDRTAFKRTMELGLSYALSIFAFGTILLVWLGTPIIKSIGGQTELLSTPLLAWMGLTMFLELGHSLAAGVIMSGNQVPFVKPAIFSGIAVVLLSWIGLKYGQFGVAWLVGAQFAVQLVYNNWKWPWVVYRDFYYASK